MFYSGAFTLLVELLVGCVRRRIQNFRVRSRLYPGPILVVPRAGSPGKIFQLNDTGLHQVEIVALQAYVLEQVIVEAEQAV